MNNLPKDILLEFNPDTLQYVRTIYGMEKVEEMREAIDIFDEWVKKQNHFVKKDFDRGYLERTIIAAAKGSVERAKGRLDKLCTLRTLLPQYFGDFDVRQDFKNLDILTYTPLPKLTASHERVFIVKCSGKHFDSELLLHGYRYLAMVFEYLRAHDYSKGYIFIVDMMDANLSELLPSVNIDDARQIATVMTEGFGVRVSSIHMLTTSKLMDTMVLLMKQVMNAKLSSRIQVHKTLESLQKNVPVDILPIEYGGKERTLKELNDGWIDVLSSQQFRKYLKDIERARTDETCRQTDKFNEQYMGMPGTFRTLKVD